VLAFLPVEGTLKAAVAGAVAASTLRSGLRLIQQRRKAEGQVAVYAVNDILCTLGGFALGAGLARLGVGAVAPSIGLAAAAGLFCSSACRASWPAAAAGASSPSG
jgi:hypothetical protein